MVQVASLLLAAGCLWFALHGLDWAEFGDLASAAHLPWLIAAAATLGVSYAARAWRLAVVLPGAPFAFVQVVRLFWATTIGYLLNTVLPARAGDVARAGIAARVTGTTTATVLGSTLLERAGDVLVLSAVMMLAVPRVDGLPDWILDASQVGGALVLVLFIASALIARSGRSRGRADAGDGKAGRVRRAVAQFGSGLGALRNRRVAVRFTLLTAAIWAIDTVVAIELARAFSVALSPVEAIVLLGALGLASAAPSTPGYVGVFQAVGVAVLVPFGLSAEAAVLIVTSLQGITLVVTALLGGIGMLRLGMDRRAGMALRQEAAR